MNHMLSRLYEHLAWADQQVLESLASTQRPPAEAIKLLGHVLAAERFWLARIRREDLSGLVVWPEAQSLDQCRQRLAENRTGYQSLVAELGNEDLAATVSYRTTRGDQFENALEDILLHVALHGAHHRGQIAAMARHVGLEPASTDYILFARS